MTLNQQEWNRLIAAEFERITKALHALLRFGNNKSLSEDDREEIIGTVWAVLQQKRTEFDSSVAPLEAYAVGFLKRKTQEFKRRRRKKRERETRKATAESGRTRAAERDPALDMQFRENVREAIELISQLRLDQRWAITLSVQYPSRPRKGEQSWIDRFQQRFSVTNSEASEILRDAKDLLRAQRVQPKPRRRVVVVDDDSRTLQWMESTQQDMGNLVFTASSPSEFRQLIDDNPELLISEDTYVWIDYDLKSQESGEDLLGWLRGEMKFWGQAKIVSRLVGMKASEIQNRIESYDATYHIKPETKDGMWTLFAPYN